MPSRTRLANAGVGRGKHGCMVPIGQNALDLTIDGGRRVLCSVLRTEIERKPISLRAQRHDGCRIALLCLHELQRSRLVTIAIAMENAANRPALPPCPTTP